MLAEEGCRKPATEQRLRGRRRKSDDGDEATGGATSEQCFGQDGPTIASLPSGVLSHIFDVLGPRDLAAVSCVCKAWRRLVALEAAANQLSGARWPTRPSPNTITASTTGFAGPSDSTSQGGIGVPSSNPISVPGSDRSGCASTSASSACCSATTSASTTPGSSPEMRWQSAYGTKMLRLKSWSGRYSSEQVVGHKMAVRAVRLLPSRDLMATASLDRTVRLWDLRSGLPLGHSRPHGGTVRCLALDTGLIASGSSDSLVRIWQPRPSGSVEAAGGGGAPMPLFNISSKPYILRGHGGPVSCLALDEPVAAADVHGTGGGSEVYRGTLFSGSWDCTVRIWRQNGEESCTSSGGSSGDDDGDMFSDCSADAAARSGDSRTQRRQKVDSPEAEDGGWSCAGVLQYGDWVYCCAVRAGNLLVAAGSEVSVTDAATGRAVRRFADLHDGGAVACLEGCRSGRLLFTASGDGLLLAHDLRMKQGSRVLWHHNAAVTGLAFEDPWLASSSADGCIILQDSEQALAGGTSPQRALSSSCRALHCPAGQPALCLDLADQWLAAGTESGVVRMWDFTGAAAAAERAAASRAARSAAKANRAAARQQRAAQQQQQPHSPPMQQQQPQAHHSRRHRGRHDHLAADPHPSELQQQLQQQRPVPQVQDPGLVEHAPARSWPASAALPTPGQQQQQRDGKPAGRPGTATGDRAEAADATGSSRRGGRAPGGGGSGGGGSGGGGSSDRWRHGGSQHHRHSQPSHAPFPRGGAPRPPPPPVAPTFRYVGSGASGPPSGGMVAFSGMVQQRPQRPQRQ